VLAASLVAYAQLGRSWPLFLLLFLTPDLSIVGYLAGPRLGAALYNAAHSYVGASAALLVGMLRWEPLLAAALIWTAHIGFDRMLGYGLKYPSRFQDTHLGRIGRERGEAAPSAQD
jgi:hypothetical protein